MIDDDFRNHFAISNEQSIRGNPNGFRERLRAHSF